jgi:hypothetical protein
VDAIFDALSVPGLAVFFVLVMVLYVPCQLLLYLVDGTTWLLVWVCGQFGVATTPEEMQPYAIALLIALTVLSLLLWSPHYENRLIKKKEAEKRKREEFWAGN